MSDRPSAAITPQDFDNLLVADYPVQTEIVTIASGENLTRGAVLGKVTANGKYVLSASAAVDGSEDPVAVLAEDTDASGQECGDLYQRRGQSAQAQLRHRPRCRLGARAAAAREYLRQGLRRRLGALRLFLRHAGAEA